MMMMMGTIIRVPCCPSSVSCIACLLIYRAHQTGFIVLYPIGVAGEMISAYLTLPLIMKGMCPSFEGLVKECPSNAETLLYVFLFQYL